MYFLDFNTCIVIDFSNDYDENRKMLLLEISWLYFLDFNTCITFLVWQEAFQNGQGQLSKNAIVHVWKGEDWQNVTHKVIQIKYLKPRTFAFSAPKGLFKN